MYISFSAVKLFLYSRKYLYFVNLFIITSIKLYNTFVNNFLNLDNLIIKFNAMLN